MPRQRYERREPTHDWQHLRPLLKDPMQLTYEIIRPVILGWETPKERSAETGMPQRTIYYKASLFDQAGMASLLPPEPPPAAPKLDKRSLPPPMRQAIVDLKVEYPSFTFHEIATICYAQFGRRPSPHTIQLILASGPKPSRPTRRYVFCKGKVAHSHFDIGGEFKKWGKIPQKKSFFSSRWGISTTFDA